MRRTVLRRIEALEPRLAMAGTFTYADVDGDVVTVWTNLGTDTALASALTLVPAGVSGGRQLASVNLSAPEFAGTSLRIKVEAGGVRGDGIVNVGQIVTPHDLAWVTVEGDLGASVPAMRTSPPRASPPSRQAGSEPGAPSLAPATPFR